VPGALPLDNTDQAELGRRRVQEMRALAALPWARPCPVRAIVPPGASVMHRRRERWLCRAGAGLCGHERGRAAGRSRGSGVHRRGGEEALVVELGLSLDDPAVLEATQRVARRIGETRQRV
jgi:hypothetical protein